MSRPTLLLVSPERRFLNPWDLAELARVMGKGKFMLPLALPTLAALTPDGWDVRIVDEELQDLPDDAPTVVGVTATLTTLKRAFEIADHYRARGSRTVLGGACATLSPARIHAHFDAVVVGEAEDVWAPLLADVLAGRLQPVYQPAHPAEFRTSPRPRWDLVDTRRLLALGVQASRGCPFSCEFCIVHRLFGRKMRYRDPADVAAEVAGLPLKQVFFADDNLTMNRAWLREFLPLLEPAGASWTCEASIDITRDEDVLRRMSDAGCSAILIGFESVNPQCLQETGKRQNRLDDYYRAVERVHRAGIHVLGSFIAGFDADGPEAFDQIRDFTRDAGISYANLNVLTVAPGTELWDRMDGEGRLLGTDTDRLNGTWPSMRYQRMSHVQVVEGWQRSIREVYAFEALRQKGLQAFALGGFRRPGRGGVTFLEKVRGSWYLVRELLLSRDPARRRLFRDMFRLGRSGVAHMTRVVEWLMFVTALAVGLRRTAAADARDLAELRSADVRSVEALPPAVRAGMRTPRPPQRGS